LRIMSGMGGLNARSKKQQFITKRAIVMINTLYASQQMRQLLVVAFRNCNIPCCSGNPLQPFLPRIHWKHVSGQEQNLGMVKIERIGQSACLLPKQMVGRQRLNGYGYCKYMQCLRYSPLLLGNLEVLRCLQQLDIHFQQCYHGIQQYNLFCLSYRVKTI
jgi:hypothetical protein